MSTDSSDAHRAVAQLTVIVEKLRDDVNTITMVLARLQQRITAIEIEDEPE